MTARPDDPPPDAPDAPGASNSPDLPAPLSPLPPAHDVTRMLEEISDGRRSVDGELLPLVYAQLRAIAGRRMAAERHDHTLDATALVHEAWMRLVNQDKLCWSDRRHFYGAAAGAMRRILVEHARRRGRQKRGGGMARLDLEVADLALEVDPADILAVDEALVALEAVDERAAEVVKLRFFAGLEVAQAAAAMGISERTARREWIAARAFLMRALAD